MARAVHTTTDHDEIRSWAETHGGRPAAVKGTGKKNDPGILRIDFPGFSGEGSLRPISWDEFYKWFDANDLALVYREDDRFNKLISRETAKPRRGSKAQTRSSARRTPTTKQRPRAAASGPVKRRTKARTTKARTTKARTTKSRQKS